MMIDDKKNNDYIIIIARKEGHEKNVSPPKIRLAVENRGDELFFVT